MNQLNKIISYFLAAGLNTGCGELNLFDEPTDFEEMLLDCAETVDGRVDNRFLEFLVTDASNSTKITTSCTVNGAVRERCPDLYGSVSLLYTKDLRWVPSWDNIIGFQCKLNDSRCIVENVVASLKALMDYCDSDRSCVFNNNQLLISEHVARYDGNLCFGIAGYSWE
ncbi:MAG: hypothetical protein Q8Q01_03535 [archaeon]|nr:hypothetical protein [archaeon]